MEKKGKKIVCLGGGIGTVNLIKGLKNYTENITVVVSMADDGGSAGRLRRFYSLPPPGDIINCIAATSTADPLLCDLLTYRFSGNRYGSDYSLPGQKLGNLMLVALASITGDFHKAVYEMQKIFKTNSKILPSTAEDISIWAETSVGEKVYREENIDLGRFTGKIERLHIKPSDPKISLAVKKAIEESDVVIGGPGDLYTTTLPVIIVPRILQAIESSKAKKFFVVNVANKIFETPSYKLEDYIKAIVRHCGSKVFTTFFINNNFLQKIPEDLIRQYEYVSTNYSKHNSYKVIEKDLINENFPLYHDSEKLARVVLEAI